MNKEQFETQIDGGADYISGYDDGEEKVKKNPAMYEEEMSPAEHWEKIKEITATLAVQVKDLQDLLDKPLPTILPL